MFVVNLCYNHFMDKALKQKLIAGFLIFPGILFIAYDVLLLCLTPKTFWDTVFSFTHIWLMLGAYLIFCGIYRLKKQHSFWSSWKKPVKLAVVCVIGVGAIISAINLSFILRPKLADVNESVDYVIILGGGIDKNGRLPKNVLMRLDAAAEFLNRPEQKNAVVVVTGGTLHWLPYAEAPELKRQLVLRGVEEERVLVEDQALDTIQNFQYSCKLLEQYSNASTQEILNSKIAVVTSYFHLRRAERLASRMGFTNIKGIGCHCEKIKALHIYVREICSYIKLNLRILLTGKPERLSGQAR